MTLPDLRPVPADDELPSEPDVVVREQDTWLVLGRDPAPEPTAGPPGELLREAEGYEPRTPGTVVVREGSPAELAAVVHDLDREPTWTEAWVGDALEEVVRELHARGAAGVSLPVLGAVHGTLHPLRFRRLLHDALAARPPWALERIWLRRPRGVDPRAMRDVIRLWGEG